MRFIFMSNTSSKDLVLLCDTEKKKYMWDSANTLFDNATIVRVLTLKELKELEIALIKNGFVEA